MLANICGAVNHSWTVCISCRASGIFTCCVSGKENGEAHLLAILSATNGVHIKRVEINATQVTSPLVKKYLQIPVDVYSHDQQQRSGWIYLKSEKKIRVRAPRLIFFFFSDLVTNEYSEWRGNQRAKKGEEERPEVSIRRKCRHGRMQEATRKWRNSEV